MFTLGAISCRDQTTDMQTSLREAFQHFGLVLALPGHTATKLSLTFYSLIVALFIVLGFCCFFFCYFIIMGGLKHSSKCLTTKKTSRFIHVILCVFHSSSTFKVSEVLNQDTFCPFKSFSVSQRVLTSSSNAA